MLAKNYNTGQKFKHKYCNFVKVVEINGEKLFENESGDLFDYIDEDYILYEL